MASHLPVIELCGTPRDKGLAHGHAMAPQIREFCAAITGVHRANNSRIVVDEATLITHSLKNLPYVQQFAPELVEEMHGIAEGAGVSFEQIFSLNCFLELEELRAPVLGAKGLSNALWQPDLWGCTTYNVLPEATRDGRALIGQTFDMEKVYEKYLCMLRIAADEQGGTPASLVMTFAGMVGINGLSAAGIGAVINKVAAADSRAGVIYPVIMRKILSARRIGDALGAVIYSSRAGGINYQLSGSGIAFCAETSASYYQLLEFEGAIAHTNHYLGDHMRRFETPNWLSHGGTMVRREVARRFLRQRMGELTIADLHELSRDHTNYPRCICAHGFEGEGEDVAFHSVFAVAMEPATGVLEVCVGNPCEGSYQRYEL